VTFQRFNCYCLARILPSWLNCATRRLCHPCTYCYISFHVLHRWRDCDDYSPLIWHTPACGDDSCLDIHKKVDVTNEVIQSLTDMWTVTTLNHTTMSLRHSKPCTGFQAGRGLSSSCVCWSIWSSTNGHLSTYRTWWQLLHLCLVGPQTARPATTTLSSSQPDSNVVNAPSPDRASGINWLLTSKPSQTLMFLGANLSLFYFCQPTLSTHKRCSGTPVICRWQYKLCIIVLYCIVRVASLMQYRHLLSHDWSFLNWKAICSTNICNFF